MSGGNLLFILRISIYLSLHEVQLTELESEFGMVREGSLFSRDAAAAAAALASAAWSMSPACPWASKTGGGRARRGGGRAGRTVFAWLAFWGALHIATHIGDGVRQRLEEAREDDARVFKAFSPGEEAVRAGVDQRLGPHVHELLLLHLACVGQLCSHGQQAGRGSGVIGLPAGPGVLGPRVLSIDLAESLEVAVCGDSEM